MVRIFAITCLRLLFTTFFSSRYVRCIKPNMTKSADCYDTKLVLDQLKYLGMLEIIRIRKQGFPIHHSYEEFVHKYKCLMGRKRLPKDMKDAVK